MKYIYIIQDLYDTDFILGALAFDHPLTSEEKHNIQCEIEKIKTTLCEEDWQVKDILEELGQHYNFEEIDIQTHAFKI